MNKFNLTDEQIEYAIEHLNCTKDFINNMPEQYVDILLTSYNKYIERLRKIEEEKEAKRLADIQRAKEIKEEEKVFKKLYNKKPWAKDF